ncbi:hypothetical protein F4821DRAFT_238882 [Hypoxylon rubiginosum]|uniref:Uncharacterized protein n=1 Tax=Hypoxylon rubiginosum TaxID=110542 RepID=A0ACC0D0R5_9PEZI|nr:hypothetical protein F4821DRAFT_238882 [Hypoxylon rubiginosum]
MGGLLIKQALINAHNSPDPHYKSIKEATSGLIFFATPHNGGDQMLVTLGGLAAKMAKSLGFRKGDNLVKVLESGNMFSDIMSEHFRHQLLAYDIVSFWGASDDIVSRECVRLHLIDAQEKIVALEADHNGVCKFGESEIDQDNFNLVRAHLQLLHQKALVKSGLLFNRGTFNTISQSTYRSTVNRDDSESESSYDNESVFSLASTLSTATSMSSSTEINLLIKGFSSLLYQDEAIRSDVSSALSHTGIGFDRMRRNFRRLLKCYARDFKTEPRNDHSQAIVGFVSSYSSQITQEFFTEISEGNQETIVPMSESVQDSREKVEEFLRKKFDHADSDDSNLKDTPEDRGQHSDSDSDSDSVAPEAGEDGLYDGSLSHFDQIERSIVESTAYQNFRRGVHEFVYPDLGSRLRTMIGTWSEPGHKYHTHVVRYALRNLVAEIQYIRPDQIQFNEDEKASNIQRITGYFQDIVERRTGELWDWWPLPPRSRVLKKGETRVRWECTCGEIRWAEVPEPFAKRLKSIIRSLPQSILPSNTHDLRSPPTGYQGSNSSATSGQGNTSSRFPKGSQGTQQLGITSPTNANHSGTPGHQVIDSSRILCLVNKGGDFKLAQIGVCKHSCRSFFGELRKDYFCLRGFRRRWFSVWRYSHCDFYMCERFDDHAFTPRQKNALPETTHVDYEYQREPMGSIPPISEHEFNKRFYDCHHISYRFLHFYHKCKKSSHTSKVLQHIPKKKTELKEEGDSKEYFWAIYAREAISLRWVVLYNFICAFPMLVFFVVWTVPSGYSTDLQNPSVPLTMVLTMMSLFWSIFLSSSGFGKSH